MDSKAPLGPAELHQRRVRLAREPRAAAEARIQAWAVLASWKVPLDPDIAVLLTSDLVTNAIMHGAGKMVTVAFRCSSERLRVDVYDSSRSAAPDAADWGDDPGLALVSRLADEWGAFRTPAGNAAYFLLSLKAGLPPGRDDGPEWITRGSGGL
jgi:hypothetical protein